MTLVLTNAFAYGASPAPPPPSTIAGVGSASTSLTAYPKTASVTTGDIWVDPTAGSGGTGTEGSPFNNLASALAAVSDGERIIVRGGTLTLPSRIIRSTLWATGIEVFAYGTDRPIIDATNLGSGINSMAVTLAGAREHWKGFHVKNTKVDGAGFYLQGTLNKVEDVYVSHGLGNGIYIADFGTGASDNLVQDCAVWRIGDGTSVDTNVPDAFVCTGNTGSPTQDNTFVRCFAANGPDDNFDLFRGRGTRLIDCVALEAGKYWNGNFGGSSSGDGGNYKMGGGDSDCGDNHALGCLAIDARAQNFAHNEAVNTTGSNPNIAFYRCSSVGAGGLGFDLGGDSANHLNYAEDCISYLDSSSDYIGANASSANCTWDLAIANPSFEDAAGGDYSLAAGSSAIAAGVSGGNLGASTVALEIALEWLGKDLT